MSRLAALLQSAHDEDVLALPVVSLRNAGPGVVRVAALAEHRICIQLAPVRAACRCDGPRVARTYAAGDMDLVPAGVDGVWDDEGPTRSLLLRLPVSLVERVARETGRQSTLLPRFQIRDPRIEHIAWALEAASDDSLYRESLGLAFASCLLERRGESASASPQGLSRAQLRRVTELIEEEIDGDLSLSRLAGVTGMGVSHFRALFKRSLGMPVHRYVMLRRVERARALLERDEYSISRAAFELGFAHASHLARAMRQVLGVSPSEIRARR